VSVIIILSVNKLIIHQWIYIRPFEISNYTLNFFYQSTVSNHNLSVHKLNIHQWIYIRQSYPLFSNVLTNTTLFITGILTCFIIITFLCMLSTAPPPSTSPYPSTTPYWSPLGLFGGTSLPHVVTLWPFCLHLLQRRSRVAFGFHLKWGIGTSPSCTPFARLPFVLETGGADADIWCSTFDGSCSFIVSVGSTRPTSCGIWATTTSAWWSSSLHLSVPCTKKLISKKNS
jgi:hypothetical protein